MQGSRQVLLSVLPIAAAAIAFWLLGVSPKRQEASDLESRVGALQAQVSEQQQLAATAEAARREFPRAYRRVVVLGKATPEDDDTSSLLVQLDRIATDSGVEFVSLESEGGEGAVAPPPPPPAGTPQTPAATAAQDEQQVENVEGGTAPTAPPPATEATAALLPIGATIGPAGLPVMKYSLQFAGDFFRLADFLEGIDDMVKAGDTGDVGIRGRLITVDSFDLTPSDGLAADGSASAKPKLAASFTVTTYLTPPEEGTTGGASPTGPAVTTEPQPASTAAPTSEPTATASTTTP